MPSNTNLRPSTAGREFVASRFSRALGAFVVLGRSGRGAGSRNPVRVENWTSHNPSGASFVTRRCCAAQGTVPWSQPPGRRLPAGSPAYHQRGRRSQHEPVVPRFTAAAAGSACRRHRRRRTPAPDRAMLADEARLRGPRPGRDARRRRAPEPRIATKPTTCVSAARTTSRPVIAIAATRRRGGRTVPAIPTSRCEDTRIATPSDEFASSSKRCCFIKSATMRPFPGLLAPTATASRSSRAIAALIWLTTTGGIGFVIYRVGTLRDGSADGVAGTSGLRPGQFSAPYGGMAGDPSASPFAIRSPFVFDHYAQPF